MSFPIAVFISGNGTTLQNFIDRIADGSLPVRIAQVISSRPGVKGIDRARAAGLPVEVIDRRGFANIESFSEANFDLVRKSGAMLVCLAGYLQLLRIPEDYRQHVINIHPALLPAFGGKGMYGHHVHEAAIRHGVKVSGCTVHFVDDQYDHGPIIAQRAVEVKEGDMADALAARVFAAECELYPEVIRNIATAKVSDDKH